MKMLSEEEFRTIYQKVPRLCVEVIVKTEEGIVLTLRSIPPYQGQWHVPGGTVYFQETLEQAVHQVAKEELGIKVEIEKLLGYIEYPSMLAENYGWAVGIAFLVRLKSGQLRGSKQGEEVGIFKIIPQNTVSEQKEFLVKVPGLVTE